MSTLSRVGPRGSCWRGDLEQRRWAGQDVSQRLEATGTVGRMSVTRSKKLWVLVVSRESLGLADVVHDASHGSSSHKRLVIYHQTCDPAAIADLNEVFGLIISMVELSILTSPEAKKVHMNCMAHEVPMNFSSERSSTTAQLTLWKAGAFRSWRLMGYLMDMIEYNRYIMDIMDIMASWV